MTNTRGQPSLHEFGHEFSYLWVPLEVWKGTRLTGVERVALFEAISLKMILRSARNHSILPPKSSSLTAGPKGPSWALSAFLQTLCGHWEMDYIIPSHAQFKMPMSHMTVTIMLVALLYTVAVNSTG